MGFIEDLYYGNIHPWERGLKKESQYAKELKVLCDNEQALLQRLSGKELKLFNELEQAGDKIREISEIENFKIGFRLGAGLIYDLICEDNSTFKKI